MLRSKDALLRRVAGQLELDRGTEQVVARAKIRNDKISYGNAILLDVLGERRPRRRPNIEAQTVQEALERRLKQYTVGRIV